MADRVLAITRIHGIAGRRDELRALMRETEERVASEPGCRMYRFAVTLDDADEYVHVQEWADEDSFRAHQRSPAPKGPPSRPPPKSPKAPSSRLPSPSISG